MINAKETIKNHYQGEHEIIIKDKNGNIISQNRYHNLIKIFAKEILDYRSIHNKIWDPTTNSGGGGWIDNGIDPNMEMSLKYILFGASFDDDGNPLGTNDRSEEHTSELQ